MANVLPGRTIVFLEVEADVTDTRTLDQMAADAVAKYMTDDDAARRPPAPTPEQQTRLEQLASVIEHHGKTDLVLLLLAVTAMATARYW